MTRLALPTMPEAHEPNAPARGLGHEPRSGLRRLIVTVILLVVVAATAAVLLGAPAVGRPNEMAPGHGPIQAPPSSQDVRSLRNGLSCLVLTAGWRPAVAPELAGRGYRPGGVTAAPAAGDAAGV